MGIFRHPSVNLSLSHKTGGDYGYIDGFLDIKRADKSIATIKRDGTNGYRHRCYGFYRDMVISGGNNGYLKIYTLEGKEIANLVGHTGEIWSIALDGDRLVSGSSDQTIRVWDLSKLKSEMQPQLNLFVSKDNEWVAWTPEGFYNASKEAEDYIGYHINQGENKEAEFFPIEQFRDEFYRPDLIQKALGGEDISSYTNINDLLKSGLPPKVEMLTKIYREIDERNTEFAVEVCQRDGGLDNLNFYLNGKAIRYMNRTKAFKNTVMIVGNCRTIIQKIAIPYGKNLIGFDATNRDGNIFSNRATITVTNKLKPKRKPNLHLLTLSIADYQDNKLDLTFPNHDADEMIKELKRIGEPTVFGHVYAYPLKDNQVTINQIEAEVKKIAKRVDSNDIFVLYISGHGVTDDIEGDYYFIPYNCPQDADVTKQAISKKRFSQILSSIEVSKSVVFLDTCQSGDVASDEGLMDTSVDRFSRGIGSAIIAGASAKQNALDGYKNHGIFTYTLLDAMRDEDLYYREKLTIGDIGKYVKQTLPKLSKEVFHYEQNPIIYMKGDSTFNIGAWRE